MIVKNEAPVISRCLQSVRPLIDHWLIVDTGSTDGTQDIVRRQLADLPGELLERPWVDFGHNRSEALALARPHAAYSLVIDADDELLVPPEFARPALEADSYIVDIEDAGLAYQRPQLVNNTLAWRYVGVLHEFLTCPDARTTGHFPLAMRRNHDGRRRRDPRTYEKDAEVLERALNAETDPFLVARYTFYLAQSYRDCGNTTAALAAYLRRADLNFWNEEIFVSLVQAARLMEKLGRGVDDIVAIYERAMVVCPLRSEAAHGASRLCRLQGRHAQGYDVARRGLLQAAERSGGLFIEPWIFDYGLLDEFAVNASWVGRYAESRDACDLVLSRDSLPAPDRERVASNLRFVEERIAARWNAPPSDWRPSRPQGGTELMVEGLRSRLGDELDAVRLCVNVHEPPGADDRPLVLWMHHDIDQAAVQWLEERTLVAPVAQFVFVSHWQMQRYIARFSLDPRRCRVIRNATQTSPVDRTWTPRTRPKLAYASTPYRGLAVLLDAFELLAEPSADLHIWSSHRLYGPGFTDERYDDLFERARRLPGVTWHGIVPHADLTDALRDCDVLAYPNTFEETSCLVAIEAMAAGCRVICPRHGALPETVDCFARTYPFEADPSEHARRFATVLAEEISRPWGGDLALAREQQRFVRRTYDWEASLGEWRALFRDLEASRPQRRRILGPGRSPSRTQQVLRRLRDRGFTPSGIIDAGAYCGDFAREARDIFPESFILLCDALAEQEAALRETSIGIGNASHVICLLGQAEIESVPFYVADTQSRPDLVKTGASKYRENADFPMQERRLSQQSLYSILDGRKEVFAFVKLDVQGAEVDVLKGLGPRLCDVEVILAEVSLVEYNDGAPLARALLDEFEQLGFVLYDIGDEHRYTDDTLLQIDAVFVRSESRLRARPPFWR